MVELKIKENEAGQRLDKFLHKYMKEAGTAFFYKMLRKKNITLNGKKAKGSEKLCIGDEVKLFLSAETIEKFGGRLPGQKERAAEENGKGQRGNDRGKSDDQPGQSKERGRNAGHTSVTGEASVTGNTSVTGRTTAAESMERVCASYAEAYRQLGKLDIMFENHHILIVNKPVGILSQKARPADISLNEWLIGYLLEKGETAEEGLHTFRPSVCNRLDRNTSGIVICGKTLLGLQEMGRLLKDRSLHKYYHMYVKGRLEKASFSEGYLVKEERPNKVRPAAGPEKGAYIRTDYRPLKLYGDMTLAEAELITGKPHQIRLHMAECGHPLLGDYKYGEKCFNEKYRKKYGVRSQLLHACRLEFPVMEGALGDLSGLELVAAEPEIFGRIDAGEGRPAGKWQGADGRNGQGANERRKAGRRDGDLEFQGAQGLHFGGPD